MRGQGRVYRPKVHGREIAVWWLDYGVNGKRFRESMNTTKQARGAGDPPLSGSPS